MSRQIPKDTYPEADEAVDPYKHLGDGTIQIAGLTKPHAAALRALNVWKRGVYPVEFFAIGSNAGGEAMKAARCLIRMLYTKMGVYAAIVPRWNTTETVDPQSGTRSTKQGMVLRVVELPGEIVGR